jgi:hypothetical protein
MGMTMRASALAGIAASLVMSSTIAASAPPGGASVPVEHDLSGVPTLPLALPTPPAPPPPIAAADAAAPATNWSSAGGWRAARSPDLGWRRWRGPRRGVFMPRRFVSPTFIVGDWYAYGLPDPGYGRNWVRYYDDAALIDERGYVYETARGVDWDRDDDGFGYPPYRRVYRMPAGTTTVIVQSAPVVTTTTTTTYVEEARPGCRCE